jgi:hypothetical protein
MLRVLRENNYVSLPHFTKLYEYMVSERIQGWSMPSMATFSGFTLGSLRFRSVTEPEFRRFLDIFQQVVAHQSEVPADLDKSRHSLSEWFEWYQQKSWWEAPTGVVAFDESLVISTIDKRITCLTDLADRDEE